jgi:hypothetical protein
MGVHGGAEEVLTASGAWGIVGRAATLDLGRRREIGLGLRTSTPASSTESTVLASSSRRRRRGTVEEAVLTPPFECAPGSGRTEVVPKLGYREVAMGKRWVVSQLERGRWPRHGARPKAPVSLSKRVQLLQTGRSFGMGMDVSMRHPHLLRPLTDDRTCWTACGSSLGIRP